MYIGTQIEAPEGLGSLVQSQRYYYTSRSLSNGVLLVSFHSGPTTRWRVRTIHLDVELFELEMTSSPPGLRVCPVQARLPQALEELEGMIIATDDDPKVMKGIEFRYQAIEFLLEAEEQILASAKPLKKIAALGKAQGSKVHPHDLQYWFFTFILHGRDKGALRPATHLNGTWSRQESPSVSKKLGRPSAQGRRKGWSAIPMHERIMKSYLRLSGSGVSMATIYRRAIVEEFGCVIHRTTEGGRQITHPANAPFPSYGQFEYCVSSRLGRPKIHLAKYGAARLKRAQIVDQGNTSGRLANLLENVETDGYQCSDRPLSYRHETMPALLVIRAVCGTSNARVGIGFSIGGENKEAYRAMLWSMAVPKALVAYVYGIPEEDLDWPMVGVPRSLLSDRGPAGFEDLIEERAADIAIKTITPSYAPKSKPAVEASNPKSTNIEGAPGYDQSDLHVAAMMKREVLRAASENRSVNVSDRLSPTMIRDFYVQGIPSTPQGVWQYLNARLRTNAVRMSEEAAARAFLRRVKLKLDKGGVVFCGLHYNSPSFRENGLHERLVRRGVSDLTGYVLSMVGCLIWVEAEGRMHRLEVQKRMRYLDEELNVPLSGLEALAHQKKILSARTDESGEAAAVELYALTKKVTGLDFNSGTRKHGNPGRGKKGQAREEAAVIKGRFPRRVA